MEWIYAGRCWKFGDNISCDADLMKKEFASMRETRPDVLREFVMFGVDPEFHKKARPRDVIVAGKRFAQGNPHIQGLIGIAGLGLGLVVESIPRGSFRNAVNAGLPLLPRCDGVGSLCESGDELEVDFSTGDFNNITRRLRARFEPLPRLMLDIIAIGGFGPMLEKRMRTVRSAPAAVASRNA